MPSPIVAATLQAAALSTVSNLFAQVILARQEKRPLALDIFQLLRFVTLTLLTAPPNYHWQQYLERSFPAYPLNSRVERLGDIEMRPHDDAPELKDGFPQRPGTPEPKLSLKNTLTKWFIDCITAGAIMNTVAFLVLMGILKGQGSSQIWNNIMTTHTGTTFLPSSMGLSPIAIFINSRVDVLIRIDHSVIYTDKSKPNIVLKAETIWIDGRPYGPPSMVTQTSYDLCREHDIYVALGGHQNITRCFGLVYDDNGNSIALRLERAPKGNLRHFIEETPEPGYCPALPEDQVHSLSMMQRELYALGSAVYEITEWKSPYADIGGDIWTILENGIVPVIADKNIARDIIMRCWDFKYDSAGAVADDLAALFGI
ncbi:hypothetical protein QQX98_003645 [Neonectria punicea]|uniref:Protein kinase domain-containing protein n=1 Tax=Neonectria punicea TaxID=979145 RepID=A0ABR1HDD3_9HYPO